ncbi:MAG: ferrous iron transporter B, partial [Ignavibacteria bacterium]|nr:ferrous iron transporter B [Ignavibacteria bacterium]
FDPFGLLIGLNGIIIVAYIVAVPANEIVLPTVFMLIVLTSKMTGIGEGSGVLFDMENTASIEELLRAGGWTLLTAVNLMLFSLLHNPCSTTVFNIYKETKSIKWTSVATLLPLFIGIIVCFLVAFIWRLFV